MIDYQGSKRLAEAATPGRVHDRLDSCGGGLKYECFGDDGSLVLKVDHKNDEWGFIGDRGAEDEAFFLACTPAVVLALIAENERVKARLCVCRDCGGHGEIYSGHSTNQGYNQPPEPDMDVCGTCGGDGVLGPVEDFEALAAERDQLKAEVEKFKEANAELSDLNQARRRHLGNAKKAAGIEPGDDLVGTIEALRKDAERYRWLRRTESWEDAQLGERDLWIVSSREEVANTDGEHLDAAIDALMTKETK